MPQIFAEPGRLWLLVGLGIAALVVARGTSRRRSEWHGLGLAGALVPSGVWLWWVAAGCLIVAYAAPRWGRELGTEPLPGHDLVFLIDVSRSMGAEDAVPDRLGVAIAASLSLIGQLRSEPGDRVAVVAFAGRAVVRCPLTENLDAVTDRLTELRPGTIEPGGTDLGSGLAAALGVFDPVEHTDGRSIVVFSDGEDHAGSWPATIASLVEASIPVHVVAVGDAEKSSPVPTAVAVGQPATSPMTRRVDTALTQLAHATGGVTVPLGVTRGDLGSLYRDSIRPTARDRRPSPRFAERAERYSVFVSAALAAGVWGAWPQSRRRFPQGWTRGRWTQSWGRLLTAGLILLGLIVAALAAGPAPPTTEAPGATLRGLQAFREARYAAAVTQFEATIEQAPTNPVGPFNTGSALFALGRYPEATARYELARTLALADRNEVLVAKIDYALGNSSAMARDFVGAVRAYDACIAHTAERDDLVTVRADATINRAFVLSQIIPPETTPDDDADGPDPRESGSKPRQPDPNRRGPNSKSPADPDSPPSSGPEGDSTGTRGKGGAGGSGAAVPESGSPEGRLNAALQRIRAAKEKRPRTDPPPQVTQPKGSAKDW